MSSSIMKKALVILLFSAIATFAQVSDSTKTEITQKYLEQKFNDAQKSQTELKAKIYDLQEQLKAIETEMIKLKAEWQALEKKKVKK